MSFKPKPKEQHVRRFFSHFKEIQLRGWVSEKQ